MKVCDSGLIKCMRPHVPISKSETNQPMAFMIFPNFNKYITGFRVLFDLTKARLTGNIPSPKASSLCQVVCLLVERERAHIATINSTLSGHRYQFFSKEHVKVYPKLWFAIAAAFPVGQRKKTQVFANYSSLLSS
jgi:hypothetical protein